MEISLVITRLFCEAGHDLHSSWRSQAFDRGMHGCGQIFATIAVAAVFLVNSTAWALTPIEIIPHKAAYLFEMVSSEPGGGVESVTGGMTFEWVDACDGWALDQHYLLRISNSDGSQTDVSTSNVTWEAKDGLRYRFNIKRGRDGDLVEDLRGDARLEAKGGAGSVEFSKPEVRKIALPAGTKFPTDFMIGQMQAAANGSRMERDLVFEGSAIEGPQTVTTTILPARAAERSEALSPPLGPNNVWPMYVAYFPAENTDGQPETELSIDVQANGIVTGFVVDYGVFKLRANLVKIASLPETGC